jgi:PKD repeat protein
MERKEFKLCFCVLILAFVFFPLVASAVTPVAFNGSRCVIKDTAITFRPCFYDPDAQTFTATTVTQPSHGRVTSSGFNFTYTPDAGYTGKDSFTWKVSDGTATSSVVTCGLLVRQVANRAGQTIVLVVESLLLPEIQAEVDRLKSDMESEGYTVKIKPWSEYNAKAVWDYLRSEYQVPGQVITGSVLIGALPVPQNLNNTGATGMTYWLNGFTDFCYWNMAAWQDSSQRHIWVSRMWGLGVTISDSYYGDETTLLKRTLQANHDFRTGASRYRLKGYHFYNLDGGDVSKSDRTAQIREILPEAQELIPGLALEASGTLFDATDHGQDMYAYTTSYPVGRCGIHANNPLSQIRYPMVNSCSQGGLGHTVNQHSLARNNGTVLSAAASSITYTYGPSSYGPFTVTESFGTDVPFRARLKANDAWGTAILDYMPFFDHYLAIFYGDFSMPLTYPYPANVMPVMNSFNSNKTGGTAPLTVSFTASASDADGSTSYEWFPFGNGCGKVNPTATGNITSQTATYVLPHRYFARVEVVDNYKGRAAGKDIEIRVAPDSTKPLRVKCGDQDRPGDSKGFSRYYPDLDYNDASGNVWLHDQLFASGTWGYLLGETVSTTASISGTSEPSLFQSARSFTNFTYRVPLANGQYFVRLGFADINNKLPGNRVFNVNAESLPFVVNLDIVGTAGPNRAIFREGPVTVSDGELTLSFLGNAACTWTTRSTRGPIVNTIEVLPMSTPPVASINASTLNGPAPLSINFSGSGSTSMGFITKYLWDFGDGMQATGSTVTHAFTEAGTYSVQLTIYDDKGLSNTKTVTVTADTNAGVMTLVLQQGLNGYTGAKDTYIDSAYAYYNYGSNATVRCYGPSRYRMLFGFDLTTVPANITILSAQLKLYCQASGALESQKSLEAYPITSNWAEGTLSGRLSSNSVNWVSTGVSGAAWKTAGGDMSLLSAAQVVSDTVSTNSWISWDLTNLTHLWKSGSAPNYGVEIFAPNSIGYSITVPSKEYAVDSTLRPKLILTYINGVSTFNHAPVATPQTVNMAMNTSVPITLSATDTDKNVLTYGMMSAPQHGELSGVPPFINYKPDGNFTGTDSFGFAVTDGIDLSFAAVTINVSGGGLFTITASAGANGTINPVGPTSLTAGSSKTFAVFPNTGYSIKDVLVDSVSVGNVSTYTFINLTSAHMIQASFIANPPALTSIGVSIDSTKFMLNSSAQVGQVYQIQYSTDLVTWINMGSPITATTTSISMSDSSISGVARRFYRIKIQ